MFNVTKARFSFWFADPDSFDTDPCPAFHFDTNLVFQFDSDPDLTD